MRGREAVEKGFRFLECNRVRFTTILVLVLIGEDLWEGIRPHAVDNLQDTAGILGLALVLAGVFLRSWAAGVIHKGERLSTHGPYSLSRHPLYIGSLLMAVGFCLIIGDAENLFAITIAGLLLYYPTILKEEKELAQKFGARWHDYSSRTGLLLPRSVPGELFSAWSLPQWLRNREYRALTASLAGLAFLELLHELPPLLPFLNGG